MVSAGEKDIRKKIEHNMGDVMENEEVSDSVKKFLNAENDDNRGINNESMIDLIESLLNPKQNNSGGGGRKIKKIRTHSL